MNITSQQLAALLGGKPAKKPKYNTAPREDRTYNGTVYDSKAEMSRAQALDMLLAGGAIRSYTRQPRFELGVAENVYVADFHVIDSDGTEWIEDVKGASTPKWRRDLKLWEAYGPLPLHVLKHAGGIRFATTVIEGGRSKEAKHPQPRLSRKESP